MRHFAGLLLGIVLLPIFFALNYLMRYTADHSASTHSRIWLLALLGSFAVFGIVLGFCLAVRSISPVALLVGGILIIAAEALLALPTVAGMQVNVPQLYDHPNITTGWLPLVAGFALLFGAFAPSRWHRVHSDEFERFAARGDDLFDDRDTGAEPKPANRYAGAWGSGRNDYADEPEQPYGRAGADSERTAVQQRAPGDLEPAYDYQSESARRSG